MSDVLDLGEVEVPDWSEDMAPRAFVPFRELKNRFGIRAAFMMHDIKYIRAKVRDRIVGDSEPSKRYSVTPVWPDGETAVWEFDRTVGWPIEDGVKRDWRKEWKALFEGVA